MFILDNTIKNLISKDIIKWEKKYGNVKYIPNSKLIIEHQKRLGINQPKKNPSWNKITWWI